MTWKKLQRVLACLLAVLLLSQVGAFLPAARAAGGYELQNGTAIIKSTMTTDEVNHALTRALVKDFDQMSEEEQNTLLDSLTWEYYCEGKEKKAGVLTHSDWGKIDGFESTHKPVFVTYTYTHPALAANKDGDYKVRLVGTKQEVTLTKAKKLSSSITLKEGTTIALPYKEDGTLDFDALRMAIFAQVVDSTTPKLTVNDVTIKYYAKFATEKDRRWVPLEGETVEVLGKEYGYPAISAGEQKIQISYAGNNKYFSTSPEVTVTFTERADSHIVLKEGQTVALPYVDATTVDFDALRATILQQVVDEGTTPALTLQNTEIEYYASSALVDHKEWVKLEGEYKTIPVINKEIGYPAISAGEQQIRISFKGDDEYKASSDEVTVTFAERPAVSVTRNDSPTFQLNYNDNGDAIYDNIQQQVFDAVIQSTDPTLTANDVTIEYYATATSGSFVGIGEKWAPLEGGKVSGLTYPAISEGTQKVRISYPGSRDYAPFTIEADVVVTGREAAPFQLKQDVTEVGIVYNADQSINYAETAQALREALIESTDSAVSINDLTVEYNAGTRELKNFQPLDFNGIGFKFGLNGQTIRFTWRGNAAYMAYTQEVDVTMVDNRQPTEVVLKPSISIVYNMDASVMKQNIFEYVIDWDGSKLPDKSTLSADDFTIEYYATAKVVAGDFSGDMNSFKDWVPIEGKGVTLGKLQLLYPQMGAGEQKIRVTFNGDADYSPSNGAELPEDCYLTVKKANVSVKVHSTSIYADEELSKDFVTTDPADKFDIFTIYTGVSSVFVQLPERFTDNAFIKAVDPVLESVGLRTIKDIMDKGITVGELKQSLDKIVNGDEYAAVREVLKLMGIDVTTLQQIINVFNKITLLDNVRIALRTPNQVGIYTVYAITNNDNYNTGFGMGALVVKKHYSGVKLTWNQNFTNGKLTQEEAKDFDFGATLSYNGDNTISQSNVKYLYSGFTSKWKPYSSTTAPTEPGRYVMTVVTLGGNYQAAPMTRSFQITK